MAWALKSADSKFTTFLADKILVEYSTSGTFSSTDLLDSLDASIVVSDRLTFLGKYREFYKLVVWRNQSLVRQPLFFTHSFGQSWRPSTFW